jgi:hypothetical protein
MDLLLFVSIVLVISGICAILVIVIIYGLYRNPHASVDKAFLYCLLGFCIFVFIVPSIMSINRDIYEYQENLDVYKDWAQCVFLNSNNAAEVCGSNPGLYNNSPYVYIITYVCNIIPVAIFILIWSIYVYLTDINTKIYTDDNIIYITKEEQDTLHDKHF